MDLTDNLTHFTRFHLIDKLNYIFSIDVSRIISDFRGDDLIVLDNEIEIFNGNTNDYFANKIEEQQVDLHGRFSSNINHDKLETVKLKKSDIAVIENSDFDFPLLLRS